MSPSSWRQPVKMADAVSATLQRLGLEGPIRQHDIWRVWSAVVGPEIARHAQPYSFRHGRLVVHVTDSVWLHHLSMMRQRLLAALKEQLSPTQIREMFLRVGEVTAVAVSPLHIPGPPQPASGIDPARLAEIEKVLASLGDAPFRDALRQLWLRATSGRASSGDDPQRQPG